MKELKARTATNNGHFTDSQSVLTIIQEELRESLAYCQTMLS
jgi:hypothetical protein